jgi:drug/metabolite transporter (DMT)-like permease
MLADMESALTRALIAAIVGLAVAIMAGIIKWAAVKRRRMALPSAAIRLGDDAPPAARVRLGFALLIMLLGPLLSVGMYFLCWWLSSLGDHTDKDTYTTAANLGLAVGGLWVVVMAVRHHMRVRRDACIKCHKHLRYYAHDTGLTLTCPKCTHTWQAGTVHADVHGGE